MMWAAPDSKRFVKGIVTALIVILLTLYFHNEYLSWTKVSNNINFVSISYIIKNLIILVSLLMLYFYLKKPIKKDYAKVKGEEKIYTRKKSEYYFDKFKNKDKLRTKAERILEKDDKE